MQGWLVAIVAFAYLAMLFAVAAYGDRRPLRVRNKPRRNVYALSIAVYCTSWTFFGSVGVAADRGFEYFGIFVGPILLFTIGLPFIRRIVSLSKAERITSIADFLAARYGKNARIAAVAALIAIIGTVPYIALQLKAISDAVTLMVTHYHETDKAYILNFDVAFVIALSMIAFAILFGTRHADATEHQDGLILAVAIESLIKISTFLLVAVSITFFLFDGVTPLWDAFKNSPQINDAIQQGSALGTWTVLAILSASAVLVLPRQFHVIVVENRSWSELKRASWIFPLYLIVINAFVMPIAIAGMLYIEDGTPADLYLLALPLQTDHNWLAVMTFIGGLSAATAMVIVATVALSIMISNNIVIPLLLWRSSGLLRTTGGNWSSVILNTRRISIAIVIFAAFAYYQQATQTSRLATIGLLSFAAIAQFVPAMVIGMFWRGANARGAVAGMLGGFAIWFYTLLIPALGSSYYLWIENGPFGITALKPEALFGLNGMASLNHGVLWSLSVNILLVVLCSLTRAATPLERIQAATFVPRTVKTDPGLRRFTTTVTVEELKDTVGRYVGIERMKRAFSAYEERENKILVGHSITDIPLVRYAEQILASAIGSSSARLVLGLLLEKDGTSSDEKIRLLDDASEALQQNRDLLQIALDQMDQGISVFDRDYQLTNWNGQFRRLLDLPTQYGQFGLPLKSIANALYKNKQIDARMYDKFIEQITQTKGEWQLPLKQTGRILELRSNPMPDGGLVVTYADITGRVEAREALEKSKESLEQRVRNRTAELTSVNDALAKAQQEAEKANIGKTRFLAATGHDISQPLNAARLYTSSLVERTEKTDHEHHEIAQKIDTALGSVETIIGAVLDISRLDAGALTANPTIFAMEPFLKQLRNDFLPIAKAKGLELIIMPSSTVVKTDRALFMRLIQNLVSNAIKYTAQGKVLVGIRKSGENLLFCVYDTGMGIPANKKKSIFVEFERLREGALVADGIGLGLSIVDRISRVLKLDIGLQSSLKRGTKFTVSLVPAKLETTGSSTATTHAFNTNNVLNGMHIACIDNEPTIIEGMNTLLSTWGAKVIATTNISDLINTCKNLDNAPDVIIADYHLENDNGMRAIKKIRKIYGKTIPAILITADRSTNIAEQAEVDNITLLNKPLKPGKLRALLQSIPIKQKQAAE